MRKRLAQCLTQVAENDSRVIFITADLGFGIFDQFKTRFPDRYLNVGIAEAGMVSLAAGLASEGWKPVVYSIASFLVPKTYEQIRLLLAHNQNKIILIGAGGGFSYSMSGPSHHSLDDLSLALLIPQVNVFAPSGPHLLGESFNSAWKSDKSSYIQIGKFGEPDVPNLLDIPDCEFGVIATGVIANDVFSLISNDPELNSSIEFLNVTSLRPLPIQQIKSFLREKKSIFVVEEMWQNLSLYTLIVQLAFENKILVDVVRIGPEHRIFDENTERETRLENFGLTRSHLKMLLDQKSKDL